jgi:hypothetical protein
MPTIVDYASLVQAVTDFTHRSDLTAYVDYFIQGAQEKINKDIPDANDGNFIKTMETYFTPTAIANGVVAVPSDWLGAKGLQIQDGSGGVFTLIVKDPQWIYDVYPIRSVQGLPAYIARDTSVSGDVFIFGPYPDSAYMLQGTYYSQAPLLSNSQTTNWMVLKAPVLLHAACMLKAMPFIKDTEALAMWNGIYQAELEGLINKDKAERWGAATMQIEAS